MAKASESTRKKGKTDNTPSADGGPAPELEPDADEKVGVSEDEGSASKDVTVGADTAPATARKRPGKAEPLPMKWKVVGFSDGLGVVLLKAQDKIAANREAARLEEEQKYENVGVYTIEAALPPPPKPVRKPEPKTPASKKAKTAPKTARKPASKAPSKEKAKPTAKKTTKKKTAKPTSKRKKR
jgi:hypothetical protein